MHLSFDWVSGLLLSVCGGAIVVSVKYVFHSTISNLKKDLFDEQRQQNNKMNNDIRIIHLGMKELYKFRLKKECYQVIEQGYVTFEQFEDIQELYTIYKGFNGNGVIEDLMIQVRNLPRRKGEK